MVRRSQRGAASVEVSVIVPVLVMLAVALAGGWRIGHVHGQVSEAAAAGARAATVPVSAAAARSHADAAVGADLATGGVHCTELQVDIDTSAYLQPAGTPGDVTVSISCLLDLSDLVVPGLPGAIHLSSTATEPLDTFRERTP